MINKNAMLDKKIKVDTVVAREKVEMEKNDKTMESKLSGRIGTTTNYDS